VGQATVYLIPVVNGVAYGLLLFVAAAGLTLAFGAGGVLNLAHGTFYTLGAYTAAVLTDGTWTSLTLAILVGTVAGGIAGAGVSALLAPLAARGHLTAALLTFGVALVAGAVLVLVFGADDLRPTIPPVLDRPVHIAGHPYPGYRLVFITLAGLVAAIGWLVLARTRAGARLRAMVDDPGMLACCGTNPHTVLAAVLAAGGALAGLAGVLGAPIIGAGPGTGELVLLLSLIIVVVGGPGSVGGALLAAVAVGQVQSLGVILFPTLAPYLLFTAMAIALIARHHRGGLVPTAAR
jgi:branched-subunit amino acid ABC-type transport system permease component